MRHRHPSRPSSLQKTVFVCLDCEMTGLDFEQDRVVEVAVKQFTLQDTREEYEALVNPGIPIPELATSIHHITDEMVRGEPAIEQVLPKVLRLLGRHPIIGHAVQMDIEMLIRAADRAQIPHTLRQNVVIDTLRMARQYGESATNSLQSLREHFGIEPEGAHRAMSDVNVNIEVFKSLAKDYRDLDHLLQVLSKPIPMRAMPLGKHKGRSFKEIPLDYLIWAANKDFDQDLLFSIRSEINRRKKGNLFSQATNPFQDL